MSEEAPHRPQATGTCPFCSADPRRVAWSSPLAIAPWHAVPASPIDVSDPRGGVRWVFGDKAPYWQRSAEQ